MRPAATTPLEAYAQLLDLVSEVQALKVAALSELHSLELPPEAVEKLKEAAEALKAAHRLVETQVMA